MRKESQWQKKLPKIIVSKSFEFSAAHKLPNYDGKCKNLHGHTFSLEVAVAGEIDEKTGMVIDFKNIKEIVNVEVIASLDHSFINDIIDNPTAENIIIWIWTRLSNKLKLFHLKLYESPTSYCMLRSEEVRSQSRWYEA